MDDSQSMTGFGIPKFLLIYLETGIRPCNKEDIME